MSEINGDDRNFGCGIDIFPYSTAPQLLFQLANSMAVGYVQGFTEGLAELDRPAVPEPFASFYANRSLFSMSILPAVHASVFWCFHRSLNLSPEQQQELFTRCLDEIEQHNINRDQKAFAQYCKSAYTHFLHDLNRPVESPSKTYFGFSSSKIHFGFSTDTAKYIAALGIGDKAVSSLENSVDLAGEVIGFEKFVTSCTFSTHETLAAMHREFRWS